MMEENNQSQQHQRRRSVNNNDDDNCSVNNNNNNNDCSEEGNNEILLLGKKLQEWTLVMKMMSTTKKSNNINNNNDSAAESITAASPKIISINENDVAEILSFTSHLLLHHNHNHNNHTANNNNCQQNSMSYYNNSEWDGENYKMMLMIVQLVMMALDNAADSVDSDDDDTMVDSINNYGGGQLIESSSTSRSSSSVGVGGVVTMEEQYARRILTDGILPFASFSSTTSATSTSLSSKDDDVNVSTPEGGVGAAAVNNGERKDKNNAAVWNAKFIQAVVIQHLLPSICTHSSNNNGGKRSRNNNNTMAVDILLDSFLARMDADESSQILLRNNPKVDENHRSNGGSLQEGEEDDVAAFYSSKIHNVDDILDILCHVTPPTSSLGTSRIRVRPNATTAIINSLRDLESNLPGRLSRCRVWRRERTCSTSTITSSSSISSSYYFKFIDRPTNLIQMTTSTLVTFKQCHDYDSMPPLIYQLGLLPLSVMRHSTTSNNNNSSSSGNKGERNGGACVKSNEEKKLESEKQRGIRLRRMCLDGIVMVLDDDNSDGKNDGSSAAASGGNSNVDEEGNTPTNDVFGLQSSSKDLFGARDMEIGQGEGVNSQQQQYLQEAWTWARYNSISFIGTCSVSDPEMCKAVLSMLGGEITRSNGGVTSGGEIEVAPFRYQRLTPIKVAMGLSVSKAVPRMRTQVLEMIRTLVMEEEMIRIKCGRGVTGNMMGLGQPWMDCLVRSVQMTRHCSSKKNHNNSGVGHVLLNIISVAKFALDTESGGRGGLDLLQSLISLGFLLVDCVKRDEPKSSSTNAIPSSRLLSSVMEIASFGGNSSTKMSTVDTSAAHATASTGRFILCCLFYQSAASASHYLSSSLTTSHGASSSEGGTSLCRTVLKTSFDKFCAMAPNSVEHSLLLTDLLNFSPKLFRHVFMDTAGGAHDGLMDRQREEIIGLSLATSHLRDIIETLSNLIGGGMSSQVACDVISPAVGRILLVQATQRQGLGSLWKKTDIEDHIDHAFLLAKKALFSADVEKRKAAASLLVALLGAASVASSMGRASTWTSVIYEIKGCLRRCLTQHQPSVRMEAYSAMMALLPKTAVSSSSASQTQDSVSPASSASPASAVSPLAPRSQAGGISRMIIPSICQNSLIRAVMEVLLSSLDRYVTTPQEELHEKDARLKRAAQGVGLSQMEVEDEDEKGAINDKSMPLRFENIISKVPQRNMGQAKKGKSKASVPIGQMLFNEALSRINEPLSFLIASCFAAASLSTDNDNQNELKKALTQLRRRLAACSDIDEYLVWLSSNKQIFDIKDNSKRMEEMAIYKISTLVCVAVLAEAMLSTCEWDRGDLVESDDDVELTNQEVEDLFNLRIDAIDRAAEIMSSFVSQTKKSKKLKKIDGNSQEEPKKGGKTAKKAKKDNGDAAYTTVKTSEINAATLVRNKKLVEEAIHDLSPAMSKDFLAHSLRQFGAGASKKGEVDGIFDGEESTDVATRLYGCTAFRRFLLTKCMLLTSGSSMVVTPGVRFSSLDEPGIDEKLVQVRLASCFLFGPLLFSDFCSQCYHLDRTSASPNHSSKSDLSLAQLSLRAFSFCVRGMNFHAPNHPLSRAKRVGALLSMSMRMASNVAPQSKDGWDFYLALKNDSVKIKDVDVPIDELELKKSLLPFLSFRSKFTNSDDEAPARLCLFSELIRNGLHGEALECCQLISAAASAFNEPNMREQLSCAFLRAYEPLKEPTNEILGIDFEDVEKEDVPPLSAVVAVAFQLNHQLDGETHVPLGSPKNLRVARSAMGLPLTMIGNWPNRHHARLQRELNRSEGGSIIGVVQQLVSALHGTLGNGDNFIEVGDESSCPTKKEVKLSCVKLLLEATDDSSKEKLAIGSMISSSIEAGLDNADFVALKMIPHMNAASLSLTQRYVSSSLFSVSKVISTSAPFAENLDCNATFSSSLLKSTKRLYSILVKLILSYMNNPESLVSKETKLLLDYVTSTFMPKISALLLALSKQTTTKNGKYIAESKIESHGKIAALLVFEKEKLDNALLKVGAKLKSLGLEDESAWLEEQVVAVHSRDFEIKTDEVENAMAMEAPKERKKKAAGAGSKRKVKTEPSKKDKKKKKQKAEDLEEEDDDDEEMNDIDAVAEVVDGESDEEEEDSNEESEDEEEDSDEDDGMSLGNLTAEMGSESEEAEFD